jgi:hypothetical protein
MKKGDKSLTPHVDYTNTKAAVEATANPIEGMRAVSTDTHESGFYNGSAWVWGSGGTGGGGGYAAEVEIDFGVTGVTEATFTIIDTNVNSSSFIISQIK